MRRTIAGLVALGAAAVCGHGAQASEGGASLYLLGSGGPESAVLPPLEGVFFDNTVYYYSGQMGGSKLLPIGGSVVAGIDATIVADFATVLWVPTTDFAGGVLALGAALPVGQPSVDVSAVVTGPLGAQVGVSASDDAVVVGDPLVTAALGWKTGKLHMSASTLVNIPIGDYREGQLANLAFHRWAGDASLAMSWHDEESGWDVSGKAGITFNGENEETDYETGTEFHVEAAVEKTFSPAWSAGLQAYRFEQLTGDSGAGATLGDFKGQVTGFGATAAYRFKMAQRPATLRLRAMSEFDAVNRMEGDSVWLDFSIPLVMRMP